MTVEMKRFIEELEKAKQEDICVECVISVENTDFSYCGDCLDLSEIEYVQKTKCLNLMTDSKNVITIPEKMKIRRYLRNDNIPSRWVEYQVTYNEFCMAFLFDYMD